MWLYTKGHFSHKPSGHDHVIVRAFHSHPKAIPTTMVCSNLCKIYLLEVRLKHILTNHETLIIVCHVGIHANFSSVTISLGP